jgi:hypothetical protein
MKLWANQRRNKRKTGTTKWKPRLNDKVLVRCQPSSDAAQGVTGKFQPPFEGPFIMYEVSDDRGKLRGKFNLSHLKPYLDSIEWNEHNSTRDTNLGGNVSESKLISLDIK